MKYRVEIQDKNSDLYEEFNRLYYKYWVVRASNYTVYVMHFDNNEDLTYLTLKYNLIVSPYRESIK